ncbi:MAG: DUF2357 domain-containing protein [Flavobacteriales bacterium]|jgi:predicted component of viral defense system (DUF524 family)
MKSEEEVNINLDHISAGLKLIIAARQRESLFDVADYPEINNEARYQLKEGCFYDYELSDDKFQLGDVGENIVQPHKRNNRFGTLAPNIFAGTLEIPVFEKGTPTEKGRVQLEVQSAKTDYRTDYRDMLEFIAEKCTDLLLHSNSPASHYFDVDHAADSQSLYQQFAFIRSIIGSDEFSEAIHRIVINPATRWTEEIEECDIRNAGRLTNTNIREILKAGKRTPLPAQHFLRNLGIDSLPERIASVRKTDSVDTPENRFIKFALESFLKFCMEINAKAKQSNQNKRLEIESEHLIRELENMLHHSIFSSISRPTTLKLNSPVLQRKEGYREVLRVWLMFDLAAKLIWTGGEDVYGAGKKDIATLYEYWLFFKLLDLFQELFKISAVDISDLIQQTSDGLHLQIKQGKFTALNGVYETGARRLNIRFNYNRSFPGKNKYPDSGSWTTTLRPDYTLSFWPSGMTEEVAEREELIVHIHFDAKYKVANLIELSESEDEEQLNDEKRQNRKGIYKNADLLKMHAYKDAIRRTSGAYVLYPGDLPVAQQGFHEIIPGLGAFPVRPSKSQDGMAELRSFIQEVLEHFLNHSSQREKTAFNIYDIHKEKPDNRNIIRERVPEPYGINRASIPDYTHVLVAFYKSQEHYGWIQKNGKYNFRTGTDHGAVILDREFVSAKYLLLHTKDDKHTGELWEITSKGPSVYSKKSLIDMKYPSPDHEEYLVVDIRKTDASELHNIKWDFKKLKNYQTGRSSALPFTATLSELMQCVVK